ncbi:hypothetical protein ACJX0J_012528, partial [Zea mays]
AACKRIVHHFMGVSTPGTHIHLNRVLSVLESFCVLASKLKHNQTQYSCAQQLTDRNGFTNHFRLQRPAAQGYKYDLFTSLVP